MTQWLEGSLKHRLQIVAALVLGMGIGYGMAVHETRSSALAPPTNLSDAKMPSREAQGTPSKEGVLWLSDFEEADELDKRWETRDVEASVSDEHVTHGRTSAKLTYQLATGPAFMMEDHLERRYGDWRGYETLDLDLYNASESQQRLILKLKDKNGRSYSEDIFINAAASQHISVHVGDLKEYLDLAHIVQLNLFRWKPRHVATFYLDAVCLKPAKEATNSSRKEATGTALTTASTESAAITPKAHWQVGWSHSLTKIFREPEKLSGENFQSGPIQVSLARGEYESVQLVLIGADEPQQLQIQVSPLVHANGQDRFPDGVVEIRQVGYVHTQQPYYPVTFVGDWPDPLPLAEKIEVPVREVQPLWITLGAPASIAAGRYEGTLNVSGSDGRSEQLALQVTVWDFTLPRTPHLKTAFDFYRSRLTKAYREFVPGGSAWEGRTEELAREYYLDMLKHRVFPILQANPSSSTFRSEIALYLDRGLGILGVGTVGGSNGNNWPKDPAQQQRVMAWYRDAASALKLQNLLDRAYVYAYDEPTPGDPRVAQVMADIHSAAPELKNLLVMHYAPDPAQHADWLKDADILCIRMASYDPAQAAQFKEMGKEVWMYVSSPAHPFPALVIDYPALSHRIIPWLAWKYNASGLLYWCVNFWNTDPWENPANFSKDQNGNGSLYYPSAQGPVPSIRMEVLRDGIEDYEYLVHLKELLDAAASLGNVDAGLLEKGKRLVAVEPPLIDSIRNYSKDPQTLLGQRQALAEVIEALQRHINMPRPAG